MIRKTNVRPGHDCRFAPCIHTPKGDHGIHGDEIRHWIVTEVADGRRVALALLIFTDKMPATVPRGWIEQPTVRPAEISLHVQTLRRGRQCDYLELPSCSVARSSALDANRYRSAITHPDHPHDIEKAFEYALKPPEAFWELLGAELAEHLADVTLFPQSDESSVMADIRARVDQAESGYVAASETLEAAQKEFAQAVKEYRSGSPVYRR